MQAKTVRHYFQMFNRRFLHRSPHKKSTVFVCGTVVDIPIGRWWPAQGQLMQEQTFYFVHTKTSSL
jgi:hypothetical protein